MTQDIAAVALEIVRRDRRFELLLRQHEYEVAGVSPTAGRADLTVAFTEPVPVRAWLSDVCDISQLAHPFTGARWFVDLESETIVAASPRWADVDCLPR
ncbi:MAG: hypothetical protein M3295_04995 [Chloroflexota bacterium]|nr:hypothetical protein [Chloroflexota bacterium]